MKTVRVLRFMSLDEADTFDVGFSLHNDTDHKAEGRGTDSVGFCFAVVDDEPDYKLATDVMHSAALRLSGIVNLQCCLIGELKLDPARFKHCFGYYSVPDPDGPFMKRGKLPEISAVEYNRNDFISYELWKANEDSAMPFLWSESWREPVKLKK